MHSINIGLILFRLWLLAPLPSITRLTGHSGLSSSTGKCVGSVLILTTLYCLAPGDNYVDTVIRHHDHIIPGQLFGRVKGPIVLEKVGFSQQAKK